MTPARKPAPAAERTDRAALIGLAPIMTMAFRGVDLTPLGQTLIARAQADPGDADALMDLSVVLQLKQSRELALATQAQALALRQLYHLPAADGTPAIRLLAFMAPGDMMANAPLDFLLQDSDVALDMLYLVPGMPFPPPLPAHDVAIVAVCESDANRALLRQLEALVQASSTPVLNLPAKIGQTRRENAPGLLGALGGVHVPAAARIDRGALERVGSGELSLAGALQGGRYPVIIRPVDAHAGHGLMKIEGSEALLNYLRAMPDPEYVLSQYVDYRSADGLFRKYRVALIGGEAYAVHMGISEQWVIHYLNAGMTESAEKRAEEARFMQRFDDELALRHSGALRAVAERLELDYVVIDCAETREGKLLIFELDTGAVVHDMDPVDLFPYKKLQMQKVFAAFRALLARAMAR